MLTLYEIELIELMTLYEIELMTLYEIELMTLYEIEPEMTISPIRGHYYILH